MTFNIKHPRTQRPVIHSRKRQRWLKSKWKSWERMGNSPALSEPTSRIQIHERAGRLRIQQTKWLHILEQFLGPAVIIIPSIAFQRAGALVQMVLWRSIKNNFAHRQAQEGPNPASGRRAQMSAQATATNPPPPHTLTPVGDSPCRHGEAAEWWNLWRREASASTAHLQVGREAVETAATEKFFWGGV